MVKWLQWRNILFALCMAMVCATYVGCVGGSSVGGPTPNADTTRRAEARRWNKWALDTARTLLRSGDVVLRSGAGPQSYIFSMLNQREKTYSHCGVAMIEDSQAFVYHSIGGEDNPDARLRRDSVDVFFSPVHNTGMAIIRYDLGDSSLKDLSSVVRSFYALKPRFDLDFDLATDDKLYCTEFVYKALNKAAHDTAYIKTSSGFNRRYVGVDDLYLNEHASVLWKVSFK